MVSTTDRDVLGWSVEHLRWHIVSKCFSVIMGDGGVSRLSSVQIDRTNPGGLASVRFVELIAVPICLGRIAASNRAGGLW
jgi:hypothetical protein